VLRGARLLALTLDGRSCIGQVGQHALDWNPSTSDDRLPSHDLGITTDAIVVIGCHLLTS
jgi:hypothetical protein